MPESPGARRWEVREGADGNGETLRSHIFIAASESGMNTGVIVTTTRRTYYLTCQSVKTSPIRVLRWTYATSTPEPIAKPKEPRVLPEPAAPARYHVGYTIESHRRPPDWMPRGVVDDGKKLYILYPEVTLFGSVPVARMIGPNGPQLLNARQYLHVVIIDQLPARVELRVGTGAQAEVVTITRGDLRTIECPGDHACPLWPAAAQTLARRTP
jgi:type IV secretion system protein VirB9